MTLCIAAQCRSGKDNHAVISFDQRVETDAASGENEFKWERLSRRWSALIAGDVSLARELLSYYRPDLVESEENLNEGNVLEHLYEPLRKLRQLEADRLVRDRHAISYDNFLSVGHTQLPADLFRQTSYDIANQRLEVQLVLIGWMGKEFKLFKVSDGRVYRCEPFAVIGRGSYTAEPALFQRSQDELNEMPVTAYTLFEAHKIAQITPTVGKKFAIIVLKWDSAEKTFTPYLLDDRAMDFLGEKFKEFGLKEITPDLVLPEGSVVSVKPKKDAQAASVSPVKPTSSNGPQT